MNILILGIDGYIGWPLALHLISKGHTIAGIDNNSRRYRVAELGSNSATPISTFLERERHLQSTGSFVDRIATFNLTSISKLDSFMKYLCYTGKPDAIVHLAEQPSAPWSMIDTETAVETQIENVAGTLNLLWAIRKHCPEAHLIKLGSMGEYGTPECEIPEGTIPTTCIGKISLSGAEHWKLICPMSDLLFPRQPGSFYHLSKVHDTHNIKFACDTWGLSSTDIMQGVVYGLMDTNHELVTRLDYDEYFGTVINRFCVQAIIGHPLTVYGIGEQTRGFLPLCDSIQCLTIAIENPPKPGKYRTFNQYDKTYTINELAKMVRNVCRSLEIKAPVIDHISNPRVEKEIHTYSPINNNLFALGYNPAHNIFGEIEKIIKTIYPYRNRVFEAIINPRTTWR